MSRCSSRRVSFPLTRLQPRPVSLRSGGFARAVIRSSPAHLSATSIYSETHTASFACFNFQFPAVWPPSCPPPTPSLPGAKQEKSCVTLPQTRTKKPSLTRDSGVSLPDLREIPQLP